MLRQTIILFLTMLFLFSCQSRKGKESGTEFEVPDSVITAEVLTISNEALEEIVQNVSSPIDKEFLIKEIGVPFSTKYLATTDYVDRYNTSFKMLFRHGCYFPRFSCFSRFFYTTKVT